LCVNPKFPNKTQRQKKQALASSVRWLFLLQILHISQRFGEFFHELSHNDAA
jgi:hypothetical protein